MDVYRGAVWQSDRFVDGWIGVEDGRVASAGTDAPPARPSASGVILPGFVNAHTHVGDFVARGRAPPDAGLEELVAPPDGLKHRILRETPPPALRDGMRAALAEAAAAGTSALLDFRESGVTGARLLKDAAAGSAVAAVALARPTARYDAAEADAVLDVADGFGLSALRDVPPEDAAALAAHARRRGKRFAMHWSEGVRESVDAALGLEPDFLVHAVRATADDFARVAEAAVPVVVCPRSNARLVGALPDVRGMLDAGVSVSVGSDNAMLQSVSVLDELRFARDALKGVTPAELVHAATTAPRARLSLPAAVGGLEVGDAADVVVLAGAPTDPFAAIFGAEPPRVVARVRPPASEDRA